MRADPGAALVEGYPFGPPPSAVLVSTRRTARYLQLEAAVGGAVSAAYGEAPRDAAGVAGDEAREVAGLPSLLEVMELVGGQVRAAAGPRRCAHILCRLSSTRLAGVGLGCVKNRKHLKITTGQDRACQ